MEITGSDITNNRYFRDSPSDKDRQNEWHPSSMIPEFFRKRKILSFIVGAVLCGLVLVPSGTYANLIVSALTSQIDTTEVFVSVQEPGFAFVGLYGEDVAVRPKQFPYGFNLKEVSVVPLASDLLRGKISLSITGKWLDGDFLVHWSPLADEISIKIANAALHQYPFFQAFGFSDGRLTTEIVSLQFQPDGAIKEVTGFSLELAEIEKVDPSELPSALTSLPFPITIPQLSETSLRLSGKADTTNLMLDNIRLKSSLGSVVGKANFTHRRPQALELTLDGNLTRSGFKLLGTPIKLFSSGKVSRANQPFIVTSSGPIKPAPNFKISPVVKPIKPSEK